MSVVTVQGEIIIACPLNIVCDQFVDFTHHENTKVHSKLHVSNVRRNADGSILFTGSRKILFKLQQDEILVNSFPDGSSTLRSISGTNAGLTITQKFESLGDSETRVISTVEFPVKGVMKFLSPLIRLGLQQDVKMALEEDRYDLEVRGYKK